MNRLFGNKAVTVWIISIGLLLINSSWTKDSGVVFTSEEARCKVSFPVPYTNGIDTVNNTRLIWAEARDQDVFYRLEASILINDVWKPSLHISQTLLHYAQLTNSEITQQQPVKWRGGLAVSAILNSFSERTTSYVRIFEKENILYFLRMEVPREKANIKMALTFFSSFKTTK